MINKAVGYSAFRTYGEQPYATRKQGKELELANKVWESTSRQIDKVKPLENYNNAKTIYKNSHIENTNPPDYHPQHVPKGGARTLNFSNTGTIKAFDKQEASRYGKTNPITDPTNPTYDQRKNRLLASGTQHWKSVYNQSTQKARYQSMSKIGKFGETPNGQNSGNQGNSDQNQLSQLSRFGNSARNNSLGGKSQAQIAEEMGRAKSYKNRPYVNNAKTGVTDYKFNYGEKIGATPLDVMNRVSFKQPIRDHPLKRGTNQLWTQIPNYQGFKPSELSFKDYQQKIERRNQHNKGNLKLQVSDNFLVQVPGYGGFKPQFQKTAANLRDSCLSTKTAGVS